MNALERRKAQYQEEKRSKALEKQIGAFARPPTVNQKERAKIGAKFSDKPVVTKYIPDLEPIRKVPTNEEKKLTPFQKIIAARKLDESFKTESKSINLNRITAPAPQPVTKYEPSSPTGLPNKRYYQCYLNSVLQCLIATPGLKQAFSNNRINTKSHYKGKIVEKFTNFLQSYQSSKDDHSVMSELKKELAITMLQKELGRIFDQFSSSEQQDAHDFLCNILLCLNEDINTAPKFNQPLPPPSVNTPEATQISDLKERDQSKLTDVFQSIFGNKVKCLSCNQTKTVFNSEMCLSLPLIRHEKEVKSAYGRNHGCFNETVDEGLEQFFAEERLPEDQKITCDFCKKKSNVQKQAYLKELPNVMVMQVKRFIFSERLMDYQKLDENIKYKKQILIKGQKYDLYGVVHHSGRADFGHYVAEVRDLGQRDKEVWHYCNDARVFEIDEPETDSNTAYLLFYAKSDDKSPLYYNPIEGYKKKYSVKSSTMGRGSSTSTASTFSRPSTFASRLGTSASTYSINSGGRSIMGSSIQPYKNATAIPTTTSTYSRTTSTGNTRLW